MAQYAKSYVEENDIRNVMGKMGLYDRMDTFLDLLDEIELDRKLQLSIEESDRGEGRPVEEFLKELDEEFASGYYTQENARKRIESGMYANI